MKKRRFDELSRDEQRASLVRRFKKIRGAAEELLTARESFNDELRRRGETPFKPFPEQVRIIAWCDQNLKALELGEPPLAAIELPEDIE